MATMQQLLGSLKSTSDIRSSPVIIRYNDSTSVQAPNVFRMTFPKRSNDAMLDCRSIRLRFNLNITGAGSTHILAGNDVRSIFSRVRVLSGSTVISDINQYAEICCFEANLLTSSNSASYENYLRGREDSTARAAYPNGREYICTLAPEKTLLNSDCCLPLSRCSDLIVEFSLNSPTLALAATTFDPACTFSISNIEILCNYLTSDSLSNYFNQNGLRLTLTDISYRYNVLMTQEALLRLSSSHTSLNHTVTLMRLQSDVTTGTGLNRLTTFYSGANRVSFNVLINNSLLFERDITLAQTWRFLIDIYPEAKVAQYFNSLFGTTRNVLCLDYTGAPASFRHQVSSGTQTSATNSDIVIKVNFADTPASALRADTYLFSDCVVYQDVNGRDLKIKF